MKRLLYTLLLSLFIFSHAQEAPESGDLEKAFTVTLPSGWQLAEFSIEAMENYGTSVEPLYKARFNAVVELAVDTFALETQDNEVSFLRPIGAAGEQRTIYGLSTSLRRGGNWDTTFELENNPTFGMGNPRDFFSGKLIVVGSEEETAYLADREARELAAHEAELARLAREEALREQARQSELAEANHQVNLRETQQQAEREAEVAQLEHERAMQAKELELTGAAEAELESKLLELAKTAEDDIKNHVAVGLPGYWTVSSFVVTDVAYEGSYTSPIFKQQFEATVTLEQDTHEVIKSEGLITLVKTVASAGTTRILYGTATTTKIEDGWQIEIVFGDSSGLLVGKPKDQFPGRVLVQGSDDEKAYQAELDAAAEAAHEAELEQLKREEEINVQERVMELAALNHDKTLEEARTNARLAAIAALEQEIASEDPNRRQLALQAALASENLDLQYRALVTVLSSNKSFTMVEEATGDVSNLVIETLDTLSGVMTIKWGSYSYPGVVRGNELSLERCDIILKITDGRTLKGVGPGCGETNDGVVMRLF